MSKSSKNHFLRSLPSYRCVNAITRECRSRIEVAFPPTVRTHGSKTTRRMDFELVAYFSPKQLCRLRKFHFWVKFPFNFLTTQLGNCFLTWANVYSPTFWLLRLNRTVVIGRCTLYICSTHWYTFFTNLWTTVSTVNPEYFVCYGPPNFRTHEIFVHLRTAADSLTCFEVLVCILFSYGSRRVRNI